MPFGSSPNASVFSADGGELFVANGTNNAVAVIKFGTCRTARSRAVFPPVVSGSLALDPASKTLFVGNVKGVGSPDTLARQTGRQGSQCLRLQLARYRQISPGWPDDAELRQQTAVVLANNRSDEIWRMRPRAGIAPQPVPERYGEQSVFKHVLYIIKENRTYDQVSGDAQRRRRSEPVHLRARGHAQPSPPGRRIRAAGQLLLQRRVQCRRPSVDRRGFCHRTTSKKLLAASHAVIPTTATTRWLRAQRIHLGCGALARRKSLRIYGEFVEARFAGRAVAAASRRSSMLSTISAATRRSKFAAEQRSKRSHLVCPTYIGFPGTVSDAYRASEFIKELKAFERARRPARIVDHALAQRPYRWDASRACRLRKPPWPTMIGPGRLSKRSATVGSGRTRASLWSRTIRRMALTTSTAIARWRWLSAPTQSGTSSTARITTRRAWSARSSCCWGWLP